MGWMASHTAKAVKLAARLASGEATEKDRAEAAQLARRYTKQLARVFRDRSHGTQNWPHKLPCSGSGPTLAESSPKLH